MRHLLGGLLITALLTALAACGGSAGRALWDGASTGRDGRSDAAATADLTRSGETSRVFSDALACGAMTCAPGQYCEVGCCGVAGCTPPTTCKPIPASCGGTVTCACAGYTRDAGGGLFCRASGDTIILTGCP